MTDAALTELARHLRVQDSQLRVSGNYAEGKSTIIGIAGTRGHIKLKGDDVALHLRMQTLTARERALGRDLVDAGIITQSARGDLILIRQPVDEFERSALRGLLGLHQPSRAKS